MEAVLDARARTFIEATEIWVPQGDRLVLGSGEYGGLEDFAAVSGRETFAHGEGLPGKAWAEARPVVLKAFEGSYFKRTEAAHAAGLTSAVAVPIFDGAVLKGVLVVLCGDDAQRVGAIEVWHETNGLLTLDDGYYGAARHFEFVSRHTQFPEGQGLPGGVWAASAPLLFRDLGSGYRFIRAESAGKAGLTTGLGLPVPVPGGQTYVLTLLSARGTPIARRFEIWDVQPGDGPEVSRAVLSDGICAGEGALASADAPRIAKAGSGALGQVLQTGLPVLSRGAGLPPDCEAMVALPVYGPVGLSHVVAWYV